MKLPAEYHAARRALDECVSLVGAKGIRDKAVTMEQYAYLRNDPELVARAVNVKKEAVRRIGELMEDERKAGKLAKGAKGNPGGRGAKIVRGAENPAQTLESRGIDKNLAKEARTAAAMPREKFKAEKTKAIKIAVAAATNEKAVIKAARAERHKQKRAKRDAREKGLANKLLALPVKKYAVILADPEWRFEFWTEDGKTNSSADNHYGTSPLDEIKKRNVASISAEDCVLFLWATVPMTPHALEVMAAWGFEYKSHCVWIKDKAGTGYWFRNKHELLLVGTRGKPPAPADGTQFASAIDAAVLKHSEKPDAFYTVIETYFPNLPKIELNARKRRKGWDAWGLEAPTISEAAE